jgi:glycosyltransferase involved in cell wall biosynthesis
MAWKASSQTIAVCKRTREVIVKEGIAGEKVTVLYNGVDENLFRRKKTEEDQQDFAIRRKGEFVILNVGGLVDVKNQARLLLAFKRFLKDGEKSRKVRLAICGDGYLKEKLQRFSNQLHVDKNVLFLGRVPHFKMPDLYNASDAFILPSLSEAHPWSLLEAMSCELPVAASRVGGVPETINDARFLFDPNNVHEIAEAMGRLVENADENEALGLRNRRIVLDRFTLRRHALNLKSIYVKLLEKTPV